MSGSGLLQVFHQCKTRQPDSIVPDLYNPLDWDRYSYVRYNPLKYTDPTGHDPACGPDGIWCGYDDSGYAGGTGSKGGGGKPGRVIIPTAMPTPPTPIATGTPSFSNPLLPIVDSVSTPTPFHTFCPTPPPGQIYCSQEVISPSGWIPPPQGNELVNAIESYLLPGDAFTVSPELPPDFTPFSTIVDDIGRGLPRFGVPAIYEIGKWYSLEKPIEIIVSWFLRGTPFIFFPLSPDTNPFRYPNPKYRT